MSCLIVIASSLHSCQHHYSTLLVFNIVLSDSTGTSVAVYQSHNRLLYARCTCALPKQTKAYSLTIFFLSIAAKTVTSFHSHIILCTNRYLALFMLLVDLFYYKEDILSRAAKPNRRFFSYSIPVYHRLLSL